MSTMPSSSKALDDLRRILLAPEAVADALEPTLTRLLHERSAQIAGALMEELTPAIRLAVREALREELRELSRRRGGNLALAIESSVVQVVHRQIVSNPDTLVALLCPAQPAAEEQPGSGLAGSEAGAARLELEGAAEASVRKGPATGCRQWLSRGWRRLLGLFTVLLGVSVCSAFLLLTPPIARLGGPGRIAQAAVTLAEQTETPSAAGPAGGLTATPAQARSLQSGPPEGGGSATPMEPPPLAQEPAALPSEPAPAAAATGLSPAVTTAPTAGGVKGMAAKATGDVLYLTFDDGPNETWTPQVLEVLKQYGAQATFFVIGQEAARRPELIRAIAGAGHVIAGHTWSHRLLSGIERSEFEEEAGRTAASLDTAVSPLLRPPWGSIDDSARSWAAEMGLQIVKWDIDSQDWKGHTAEVIASRVISRARPGRIVLLHDGGGNRAPTVAALRVILETLSREGYVFRALP